MADRRIKGYRGLYWRGNSIWGHWFCERCPQHPHGNRHREPLGTTKVKEAAAELAKRKSTERKPTTDISEITVTWLVELYLAKGDIKLSTLKNYEDLWLKHLKPKLGNFLATDLIYDESIITNFVMAKRSEPVKRSKKLTGEIGYKEGNIKAVLTLLSAAYKHSKNKLFGMQPTIPDLNDYAPRKGYYTDEELQKLTAKLPPEIQRPVRVLCITGWRSWSEIFSRKRGHVDREKERLILEPFEAKTSEPRVFPFTAELREILEEQDVATRKLERRLGKHIPWLFHDPQGEPLEYDYSAKGRGRKPSRYFRKNFDKARKSLGLGNKIIHDTRRTGTRSFVAAGIDDAVGRMLTGHKTQKQYDEYKALGENDLNEAAKKLDRFEGVRNLRIVGQRHKKDTISARKKHS